MKSTIIIGILLVTLMLIGCAKNATATKDSTEMQKTIEKQMASALQINSLENSANPSAALTASSANADTRDLVVGIWRAQHPMQGIPYSCVSEWIYQENGAYSGMTQCGPYAMQRTGTWSLPDNNTMRVSLRDGNYVRWDSWKFRMLDNNRMALGDGAIIAYRIN